MQLLLPGDSISVTCGSAGSVDVVCDAFDRVSIGSTYMVVPAPRAFNITSTTPTVITPTVAENHLCDVEHIAIRNKHASNSNLVTVTRSVGGVVAESVSVTLTAGQMLHSQDKVGWRVLDALMRPLSNAASNSAGAAINAMNLVVLATDVINNNATANTMADVTGLSFPVLAGETYRFEFEIFFAAAATTTGSRWAINGPASPTLLAYMSEYSLTSTTNTINSLTAYDTPAAANASSAATTGNTARVRGFIRPSANGTVTARFASEILSSAITAKAGSLLKWYRTL